VDRYTRWSNLLDLLARHERLSVEAAARDLNVSAATVRRDFEALAAQRKLLRLRGVAVHVAAPVAHPLLSGDGGAQIGPPELRRVAAQAARLLRPGSVVGLTGTAGTRALARAIGLRLDALAEHGTPPTSSAVLTVVTNDVVAATELARRPGAKVVLTGGVLDGSAHVLGGPLAGSLLEGIALDTALIAADAVDPEFGATAADEVDAGVGVAMVARARQVVVVAVSDDLDRSAFARVCETRRVDVLVTDGGIAAATADRFRNRGVRVVLS
jgi:DeoR/GlpR family transcriptional regulator of sugar metabolism